MAKTVIHIFHADDASLGAGSHVAERVRQVAADQSVQLEVFCFGPAQSALSTSDGEVARDYNQQIDELIAAGVSVGTCLNAAKGAGTEDFLRDRGLTLQFARDAFVRWAQEGAAVINF
ncbi:MAG: DsrE family protein [Acidimicrobiaceae bacterium]|nr:DsrE family protein [Acidimicrobiaceae bacterium]